MDHAQAAPARGGRPLELARATGFRPPASRARPGGGCALALAAAAAAGTAHARAGAAGLCVPPDDAGQSRQRTKTLWTLAGTTQRPAFAACSTLSGDQTHVLNQPFHQQGSSLANGHVLRRRSAVTKKVSSDTAQITPPSVRSTGEGNGWSAGWASFQQTREHATRMAVSVRTGRRARSASSAGDRSVRPCGVRAERSRRREARRCHPTSLLTITATTGAHRCSAPEKQSRR
jgi:hypothetical protein